MDTGSIEIKKKTAIPTTPTPLTGSLGTGIRTPWVMCLKIGLEMHLKLLCLDRLARLDR